MIRISFTYSLPSTSLNVTLHVPTPCKSYNPHRLTVGLQCYNWPCYATDVATKSHHIMKNCYFSYIQIIIKGQFYVNDHALRYGILHGLKCLFIKLFKLIVPSFHAILIWHHPSPLEHRISHVSRRFVTFVQPHNYLTILITAHFLWFYTIAIHRLTSPHPVNTAAVIRGSRTARLIVANAITDRERKLDDPLYISAQKDSSLDSTWSTVEIALWHM